mmetsp:Transcript_111254/g.255186  ORF Transcript_111254/g.255186 Transcript_111254/m.255186 type:complete len:228 (+) Transcript_111254:19-702(+)
MEGSATLSKCSVETLDKLFAALEGLSEQEIERVAAFAGELKQAESRGATTEDQEKAELVNNLKCHTVVKIAPSRVCPGVGVEAIVPLPAGIDPFKKSNAHLGDMGKVLCLRESEISGLNPSQVEYIKSFFAALTEDGEYEPSRDEETGEIEYGILASGANAMDVSWYMNHGGEAEANMAFVEAQSGGEFCSYVTKREIAAGEELLFNYKELGRMFYETLPEEVRAAP